MSTRAFASAIIPLPVETVWAALRDFTAPSKLSSSVSSCVMADGAAATEVGAVRVIQWKSGEEKKQRLLELSDQFRRITWETVEANHITEVMSQITTVALHRLTESNGTYIEWSTDFSADVSGDVIRFEQNSYGENLKEWRSALLAQSK